MEEYPSEWSILRYHLTLSGLMQGERVAEKIWLRFHPTLAPALWQKLSTEDQARLLERHWQAYYQLSKVLYLEDQKTPHAARAIAKDELPNLLRAVYAALQIGATEEGVDFAIKVNWFLDLFGLRRDYQALTEVADKAGGAVGSQVWYQTRFAIGEQLCQNGQTVAAEQVFQNILTELGEAPSYERCLTLGMLGRCCKIQGQSEAAERLCRQELKELARLEQNQTVLLQTASAQTVLADALRDQGQYREAQEAYQAGFEIKKSLCDVRGMAVSKGLLGTLARMQGELAMAAELLQEAVILWRSLNEPVSEAVDLHQLGIVYLEAKQWKKAEEVFREVARIQDERGGVAGSIGTGNSWNELALVCKDSGRLEEAEKWFRKALKAYQDAKDWHFLAMTLSNLAILLAKDPARLDEACGLAEESLAIKETLDPAAAEIWKTYAILADIATKQGESSQAAAYRAKSRQVYAAFPGAQQQVQQYGRMIAAVVQAAIYPALQPELEPSLEEGIRLGWGNQVAAIHRILSGQRDEAVLCEPLNFMDAAIIRAILEGIAETR